MGGNIQEAVMMAMSDALPPAPGRLGRRYGQ